MPALRYRSDIGPHYRWIGEAVHRLRDHDATKAAFVLAEQLLNYTPTASYSWQRSLARYVERLRWAGVTPEQLTVRVCEFQAWCRDRPGRLPNDRAEEQALGRIVLYMVPTKRSERPPSARVLRAMGNLCREYLGLYAVRLLAKVERDAKQHADLRAASGSL